MTTVVKKFEAWYLFNAYSKHILDTTIFFFWQVLDTTILPFGHRKRSYQPLKPYRDRPIIQSIHHFWGDTLGRNITHWCQAVPLQPHLPYSVQSCYLQNLSSCTNTVLVPQFLHENSQVKRFWFTEYGFVNSQVGWEQHAAVFVRGGRGWKKIKELILWW